MPSIQERIAKLTSDLQEISAKQADGPISLAEAERLPVGSVLTFASSPGQFGGQVIVSAPGRGSPDLGSAKDVARDPDMYSMPIKDWASSRGRLIYLIHKGRGSLPSASTVSSAVSKFMRGNRMAADAEPVRASADMTMKVSFRGTKQRWAKDPMYFIYRGNLTVNMATSSERSEVEFVASSGGMRSVKAPKMPYGLAEAAVFTLLKDRQLKSASEGDDELLDPDVRQAQAWAKERIQTLAASLRQVAQKNPRAQVEGMANAMFSMVGIMKNIGKASPALGSKVGLAFRMVRSLFTGG